MRQRLPILRSGIVFRPLSCGRSSAGRVQASEQRLSVRLRRARRDVEVTGITGSVDAIGCAAMPDDRRALPGAPARVVSFARPRPPVVAERRPPQEHRPGHQVRCPGGDAASHSGVGSGSLGLAWWQNAALLPRSPAFPQPGPTRSRTRPAGCAYLTGILQVPTMVPIALLAPVRSHHHRRRQGRADAVLVPEWQESPRHLILRWKAQRRCHAAARAGACRSPGK